MFKIKDGYKLELQTPKNMKLFRSTKVINRKNKESWKCAKSWSGWISFSSMQISG